MSRRRHDDTTRTDDPALRLDLDETGTHTMPDTALELLDEHEPEAGTVPAAAPVAPPPRRSMVLLVAIGVALVVAIAGGVATGLVLAGRNAPPEPAPPPLQAALTVRPSAPVDRVVVDGFPAVASGDAWLATVEPGSRAVLLASGDACAGEAPACGPCCACVTHPVDVVPPATVIDLEAPTPLPPTPVQVRIEGEIEAGPVRVRVGDQLAKPEAGHFAADAPTGRSATVRVDLGACGRDDAGCSALGTCPPGCGSAVAEAVVRCGGGPVEVVVPAPAVAPVGQPTAVEKDMRSRRRAGSPALATATAAALEVVAKGERLSGTVDARVLAQAVDALAGKAEACWRRLAPPYRPLPALVVEFRVGRGKVDADSLVQVRGTEQSLVDACVRNQLAKLELSDTKTGKARATFRFAVR